MTEELFKIVEAMEQYGGSFVKSLAVCFYRADANNLIKLQNAFPNYIEEYKKKFVIKENI